MPALRCREKAHEWSWADGDLTARRLQKNARFWAGIRAVPGTSQIPLFATYLLPKPTGKAPKTTVARAQKGDPRATKPDHCPRIRSGVVAAESRSSVGFFLGAFFACIRFILFGALFCIFFRIKVYEKFGIARLLAHFIILLGQMRRTQPLQVRLVLGGCVR
jgi:hypothetical protein